MASLLSRLNYRESGFTLVEVLLYLGLFGMIIGSLVVTGFIVVRNEQETTVKLETQTEANFITDKLRWLVANATIIEPPVDSTASQLVTNNFIITKVSGHLQIQYGNNAPVSLTSARSVVSGFHVRQTIDHQLIFELTLNGQNLYFTKLVP